MPTEVSYKSTIIACYLGYFTQAIVVNLTPILFIPFMQIYGLSYSQLGFLILINFIVQVSIDILFSKIVDKYGFRIFATISHIICFVGFIIFALSPFLFPNNIYIGLLIGTIIFSGAGGLLEIVISPVLNAIPSDEKAAAMSLLHSFYAWGQLAVVLVTSFLLFIFGLDSWIFIVFLWCLVPLINFVLFLKVPLEKTIPEDERQSMLKVMVKPFFIFAFFAILMGGAAEVTMNQWISAYMEKALGFQKIIGDILGMSFFAIMLGVGRLLYGIYGKKIDVNKILVITSFSAIICYLIVALSPVQIISVIACGLAGLSTSLLWPGTLVITAEKYPLAGAWIFAILAAGGDIGASIGPWFLSLIADNISNNFSGEIANISVEQLALRIGMLVAAIFPLGAFVCHLYLKKKKN